MVNEGIVVVEVNNALLPSKSSVFYEKQITSLPALFKELQIMDLDSGIRIPAKYKGKKALIFVTKSGDRYGIAICSVKHHNKADFPDKQILIKEVDYEELKKLIEDTATKPLETYSY
jgi:hypothetical protein